MAGRLGRGNKGLLWALRLGAAIAAFADFYSPLSAQTSQDPPPDSTTSSPASVPDEGEPRIILVRYEQILAELKDLIGSPEAWRKRNVPDGVVFHPTAEDFERRLRFLAWVGYRYERETGADLQPGNISALLANGLALRFSDLDWQWIRSREEFFENRGETSEPEQPVAAERPEGSIKEYTREFLEARPHQELLIPGRIVVRFSESAEPEAALQRLLEDLKDLDARELSRGMGLYELAVDPATDVWALCLRLLDRPEVEIAEPVFRISPNSDPPREGAPRQSGGMDRWTDLDRDTAALDDFAEFDAKLQKKSVTLKSLQPNHEAFLESLPPKAPGKIRIVVIDVGFDLNHPTIKASGATVVGAWDVVRGTPKLREGEESHGNHVLGTILGVATNSPAPAGTPKGDALNHEIELVLLKADTNTGMRHALEIAGRTDADIVNMSLGPWDFPSTVEATRSLGESGAVLVTAAGNSGKNLDLREGQYQSGEEGKRNFKRKISAVPHVALVANAEPNFGLIVPRSEFGPERVRYSAIGTDVVSSVPVSGEHDLEDGKEDGRGTMSGTSMAAPSVVRRLALVKQQFPNLRGAELLEELDHRAVDLRAYWPESNLRYRDRVKRGLLSPTNPEHAFVLSGEDFTTTFDLDSLNPRDPERFTDRYGMRMRVKGDVGLSSKMEASKVTMNVYGEDPSWRQGRRLILTREVTRLEGQAGDIELVVPDEKALPAGRYTASFVLTPLNNEFDDVGRLLVVEIPFQVSPEAPQSQPPQEPGPGLADSTPGFGILDALEAAEGAMKN